MQKLNKLGGYSNSHASKNSTGIIPNYHYNENWLPKVIIFDHPSAFNDERCIRQNKKTGSLNGSGYRFDFSKSSHLLSTGRYSQVITSAGPVGHPPFRSIFDQLSLSVTVLLKTGSPGKES